VLRHAGDVSTFEVMSPFPLRCANARAALWMAPAPTTAVAASSIPSVDARSRAPMSHSPVPCAGLWSGCPWRSWQVVSPWGLRTSLRIIRRRVVVASLWNWTRGTLPDATAGSCQNKWRGVMIICSRLNPRPKLESEPGTVSVAPAPADYPSRRHASVLRGVRRTSSGQVAVALGRDVAAFPPGRPRRPPINGI